MSSGLRWTAGQLEAAQARAPRKYVAPGFNASPGKFQGVDIDAAHVKPAKYRNRKTETEHGKFDSQKEAARYAELVLLERAGAIAQLRRQVPYALVCNGVFLCKYIADMVYSEGERVVVEDVKGFKTELYLLKKKLMLACHSIEVKET